MLYKIFFFIKLNTQKDTHYATSRKVAGSSPDEVNFFSVDLILPAAFMALGSTQPLTEMSTRNLPEGGRVKGGRRVRLTTLPPSEPIV
jgi:hypothetical protein